MIDSSAEVDFTIGSPNIFDKISILSNKLVMQMEQAHAGYLQVDMHVEFTGLCRIFIMIYGQICRRLFKPFTHDQVFMASFICNKFFVCLHGEKIACILCRYTMHVFFI